MQRHEQSFQKLIKTLALLAGIALSACGQNTAPSIPPWALGDGIPEFKGTIVDWAKGDAIAPGEGGIFATSFATSSEGTDIGFGSIKAYGSFIFGPQKGASSAGGGVAVSQTLCAGLTASNPQQKIAQVDILTVLSLYQEGKHARPGGGIVISVGKLTTASFKEAYQFVYASADGLLKGSCSGEEFGGTAAIDLDLRQGWNTLRRDGSGFKTAAISKEAKWYFINPLTAGQ
jgi:hypothetical protein